VSGQNFPPDSSDELKEMNLSDDTCSPKDSLLCDDTVSRVKFDSLDTILIQKFNQSWDSPCWIP